VSVAKRKNRLVICIDAITIDKAKIKILNSNYIFWEIRIEWYKFICWLLTNPTFAMIIKTKVNFLRCILFLITVSACQNKSSKNVEKFERDKGSLKENIGEKFQVDNILDTTGKVVTLDFTKSEITIIDFWFNDCPPCLEEMKQFAEILKGKENRISVISISINQFWLWKPTLTEHKGRFSFLSNPVLNWKHYSLQSMQDEKLRNEFSSDRIKELQKKYNITFFPSYFVVDKNCIIQSRPESAVKFIEQYN